jgi:hypothetical protein
MMMVVVQKRRYKEGEVFIAKASLTHQPLQACGSELKSPCLSFRRRSSRVNPRLSKAPMIPTRAQGNSKQARMRNGEMEKEKKRRRK